MPQPFAGPAGMPTGGMLPLQNGAALGFMPAYPVQGPPGGAGVPKMNGPSFY
jgi:hypothetical protein